MVRTREEIQETITQNLFTLKTWFAEEYPQKRIQTDVEYDHGRMSIDFFVLVCDYDFENMYKWPFVYTEKMRRTPDMYGEVLVTMVPYLKRRINEFYGQNPSSSA